MNKRLRNRLLSALLCLASLLSTLLLLSSCGAPQKEAGPDTQGEDAPGTDARPEKKEIETEPIDPSRKGVPFSSIYYRRPNSSRIGEKIDDLAALMREEPVDEAAVIALADEIQDEYVKADTMRSYCALMVRKERSTSFYQTEIYAIDRAFAELSGKVATMLEVAPAGLKKSLGKYSFCARKTLSSRFTLTLSDAPEELKNEEYLIVSRFEELAKEDYDTQFFPLYASLVTVRREMAEEVGGGGYESVAYSSNDFASTHDYTPEDTAAFRAQVVSSFLPVYQQLDALVFSRLNEEENHADDDWMSGIFAYAKSKDNDLFAVLNYMLASGLVEFSESPIESYSTYLADYDLPYLIFTESEWNDPALGFAKCFGEYLDLYINKESAVSRDLTELYRYCMAAIFLSDLKDTLSSSAFHKRKNAFAGEQLADFIRKVAISDFESRLYARGTGALTEEALNAILAEVAETYALSEKALRAAILDNARELVGAPFTLQSEPIAEVAALFFLNGYLEAPEKSLDSYKAMLTRDGASESFLAVLSRAGIASPFDKQSLRTFADTIYFAILGSHYYRSSDDPGRV